MFELSREDICKWRKEYNRLLIEEFKEIFQENTEEIMNENGQVTVTIIEVTEDENLSLIHI